MTTQHEKLKPHKKIRGDCGCFAKMTAAPNAFIGAISVGCDKGVTFCAPEHLND